MNILKTSAEWDKLCKSVKARGTTLDTDIHLLACSALSLTYGDRNTTRLTALVKAMPKSSRGKALVDWIEKFFPASVAYETGKITDFAKQDSDQWIDYSAGFAETLETAIDTPFWTLKPEKGAKDVLNLEAILKYLARKATSKDADETLTLQVRAMIKIGEGFAEGAQGELNLHVPGTVAPAPEARVH